MIIVHLQPSAIEEAVRSGFDPSGYVDRSVSESVLRLAKRMMEYNAKMSALLSLLSQATTAESNMNAVVLHTAQDLEGLREALIEECELLVRHANDEQT